MKKRFDMTKENTMIFRAGSDMVVGGVYDFPVYGKGIMKAEVIAIVPWEKKVQVTIRPIAS